MRTFARRIPLPILGIASVAILPIFAVYLTLCVFGAAETSDALVVGNAVKVEGQAVFDDMALESTESMRAFDVLNPSNSHSRPPAVVVVRCPFSC